MSGKFAAARDRAQALAESKRPVIKHIDESPQDIKVPAQLFAPGNKTLESSIGVADKEDELAKLKEKIARQERAIARKLESEKAIATKPSAIDPDKRKNWIDTIVKIKTKRANRLTSEWRNVLDEIETFLMKSN